MQTSWGNRQQEVGMWALDMQFNAVKGLGGASNRPKLETMEYLHTAYNMLFFCKFANLQICFFCAMRIMHINLKRISLWPTLEQIHPSAEDVKKGNFAAQRQNMPEQQQVYCPG